MLKQWGRVWAIGFVLWTVLAFLSAAGAHVYTASMGGPESWAQLLAWNITISFVWSLLTPPIYALAKRFTFDRSNWKLVLPMHLAASVTLAFLGASLIVWVEPWVTWTPEPHVSFLAHTLSRAFMDIQRYWYILLITQAIAYYGKYRERELESSQLEAQLAYAQLEVLKIQLEPHFLFNTLNSIAALARNDGPAAENMTLQLADLLRFSLDAVGVHEVPLSRELTVLQKYIDIQQTRFQDRLQVELDIAANTLPALVPNFILQPLVENAIRHGIGPRLAPELQATVAPVILLKVDCDPHQPGHRARVASESRPVLMRLQEALLGQRLRQIHIPRRGQQEPENLRPVALNNTREVLRGIFVRRGHGHRFQCCAGCHHSGRRPLGTQVYSGGGISNLYVRAGRSPIRT